MNGPCVVRRVLVVDDDERCLKLAVDVLTHAGYAVRGCPDGACARRELGRGWPELVLLDIQLPDISGQDLLQWLRRQPGLADIPVIALTASVTQDDRALFSGAGFTASLGKPLSLKELRECVSQHLPAAPATLPTVAPTPAPIPTPAPTEPPPLR